MSTVGINQLALILNAFAAVLQFVIAAAVPLEVSRLRPGRVPIAVWLVSGFFLLHTLMSLNRVTLYGDEPSVGLVRSTVLDFISVLVALVLLRYSRRIAEVILLLVDTASFNAAEYERARLHYTQLVRHRLFNPLAVVRGAAMTIRAGVVSASDRSRLCDAIIEAADEMERVALTPEPQGDEERELDAIPRIVAEGTGDATWRI